MVDTEQSLLTFDPFGVSVCEGPYRVFKWQWQNVFLIKLTDRCLRASRSFSSPLLGRLRGGAPFAIPYETIISMKLLPHAGRLGLMQVLDLTYRDAQGEVHEKSIAAYNQSAEAAFAILRRYAPQTN
jgi:hypothetical protein